MKRLLVGSLLLILAIAAMYGYVVTNRDRMHREALARGEAALAQDNTVAAIEAFSGAITLKPNSMIGYLRRGQTYRKRELDWRVQHVFLKHVDNAVFHFESFAHIT